MRDMSIGNPQKEELSSSLSLQKDMGPMRIRASPQSLRKKWCRQVRIVLATDAAYYKIIPKQNLTASPNLLSTRSSSPNSFNIPAISENEVKFKIASCLSALNETRAALWRCALCGCVCVKIILSVILPFLFFANAGGLELFGELLQRFPNNVHISLEIVKVRSLDPYVVTYMDEYAMLLKIKSDHSKLNKLAHDLLNIDSTRPEVYVALSVLAEGKDAREALSLSDKGNLLLPMKRPELAVVAFRVAQELRPDLRLVHSYSAFSKFKEALHALREAMKAMPQSAKALKLVGDVDASNSGGREKANKFYESALRLEPGYLGAALALAELHVIEGRNGDAVSLLERYLKDWADYSLHVKLAQVFAATNMLQEALSHYQAALRRNSQNEAAKKGLERLEKQMKGVDPDAPEEDEENEVEDADGDQEETELL
ncbi:Anaphase-promoting complex subunit 7 [Turnera subulata]|uniref:Anaphase-promoting complex subunit 7 n=1 Tax=Turnera subulata TaxID=218843 RepID=A0A9Q0FRG2_9ROSI|nr:Anaphase-promoting complex subunit 7 [Turnera subulata]